MDRPIHFISQTSAATVWKKLKISAYSFCPEQPFRFTETCIINGQAVPRGLDAMKDRLLYCRSVMVARENRQECNVECANDRSCKIVDTDCTLQDEDR